MRGPTTSACTRVLEAHLPFVRRETLMQCLRALDPGASRIDGIRAAGRLLGELAPCARRPRAADVGLKAWRRGAAVGRRLGGTRPQRRRLVAGGSVIALIGADGAGKSTAIAGLDDWLGRTFEITHAHLGRPPASKTTFVLKNLALARGGVRRLAGRPNGEDVRITERAVLVVANARDRMLTARRIRRAATDGGLVVSDRWPLPQLKTMDAPRIERFDAAGPPAGAAAPPRRARAPLLRRHRRAGRARSSCAWTRRSPSPASRTSPPSSCAAAGRTSGAWTGRPRGRTSSTRAARARTSWRRCARSCGRQI